MRQGLRGLAPTLVAVLIAMAAAGCGSSGTRAAKNAPVLTVVTGLYPLAQAVTQIGAGKAVVEDLVPQGADPLTYRPDPQATSAISRAQLVVMAAPGFQPSLDAATAGATMTVNAGPGASEPYFWLDPTAMQAASATIASAMERADPAAAPIFRDGERAFADELESTAIDYQSTLSTCPRRTLLAADSAFAGMAARYDLDFTPVGSSPSPDPSTVHSEAATVRADGATTVFSEPWVPSASVQAVAAAGGAKVRSLDTLLGPPPGGWPRQASYITLLEANLGVLSSALGCADASS